MAIILLPQREGGGGEWQKGRSRGRERERETAGNLQPLPPSLRPPAPLTVEPIFGAPAAWHRRHRKTKRPSMRSRQGVLPRGRGEERQEGRGVPHAQAY